MSGFKKNAAPYNNGARREKYLVAVQKGGDIPENKDRENRRRNRRRKQHPERKETERRKKRNRQDGNRRQSYLP